MMVLFIGLFSAVFWWLAAALTQIDEVRSRAELHSVERAEELRAALYGISDAVATVDPAGRVTRLNPVAERLTGWSEAEAVGRPLPQVYQLVSELTRQPLDSPVEEVLQSGGTEALPLHSSLVARDGTERPIADSASPIRLADGQVAGAVLVFRDLTEERSSRDALAQAEDTFLTIFHGSPIAMATTSLATDRYVDVNDVFLRITGFARAEVIGHSSAELGIYADPAQRERLRVMVGTEGGIANLEMDFRMKAGQIRTCLISTTIVQVRGESLALSSVVDITDRKHSEEQAKASLIETRRLLEEGAQSRRALLSMIEDQKREEERRKDLEDQLSQAQRMEASGGWRAAWRTTSTTC